MEHGTVDDAAGQIRRVAAARQEIDRIASDAAVMVEQQELSGERLAAEIVALANEPSRRRRIEQAARSLARADAA